MPRRKSKDQVEKEIETGDREEDIYTEEGREVAEDEDVITDAEEVSWRHTKKGAERQGVRNAGLF